MTPPFAPSSHPSAADALRTGRWLALSLLAVYLLELFSNFALQPGLRLGDGPLGLLRGAAAQPAAVGGVVLLGLLSGLVDLAGAALLAHWLQGRRGQGLALLHLGLCAAGLAAGLAEHGMQLALREVALTQPGLSGLSGGTGGEAPALQALQSLLAALRNGLHLPRMVLGGLTVLVFFGLCGWARLLPRVLVGLGLAAALCQMAGVGAAVLGGAVVLPLLAPLALVHLATALRLLVRGLAA